MTTPRGIHVVNISSSSFTVALKPTTGASHYRVYASTTKSDLNVLRVKSAHRSALASNPVVTVHGLPYAAQPYYYRLEAINGSHHRWSPLIGSVGLRPATPNEIAVSTNGAANSLTWQSGPATGYEIQAATTTSMTDPTVFTTVGTDTLFTPYGLTPGAYYFTVRALNGTTPSTPTSPIPMTVTGSQAPVSVMTYNLIEAYYDGRKEGSGHVAPWSERVNGVVKLIKQVNPDVISIQEAAAWVDGVKGPRQVDSLVQHLGGEYSLAYTEVPPTQKGYFRTGVYILYKNSTMQAVGDGNHWAIGNDRWAAYQVLQNTSTGAQFLMVAPHLEVGTGRSYDENRKAETESMVAQAEAYDADLGLPIVYAGDFNSDTDKYHTFDGPSEVMRADHIDDAFDVAQSRTNAKYNSSNGYFRKPPAFGYHIDYVFASPGIAVQSWKLVIDLTHGEFKGVIPSDHNPIVADLQIPY
ncbi:MAG TPA: endonuclease/exonuclease/phosphatase family protein [Mycobacteriales bacterium]|nr:endonuclease/exonuclease/phosphatase family protein [Mycobacteriales bacterium]